MDNPQSKCIIQLYSLTLGMALLGLLVNAQVYHYPGNNYFPGDTFRILISLGLLVLGSRIQWGTTASITLMIQELLFFFLVMALLILVTNAAQYTPFSPIDDILIAHSHWIPINPILMIQWTHTHTLFKRLLEVMYTSLIYQMLFIPLLLIVLKRTRDLREYYFLMIATALLGFTFYYFFPTTAPASVWTFLPLGPEQQATGLKFYQIHHGIQPTTLDGGMVAFPSFHVIWAWLCVYVTRSLPSLCISFAAINVLLTASCVLLGWHYPIDVLGSIVCIMLGHGLYHYAVHGLNPLRYVKNIVCTMP